MAPRRLGPCFAIVAIALAGAALSGCGGGGGQERTAEAPSPLSAARALAYSRAVNLRPGDLAGFTSEGGETQPPPLGALAREELRCTGSGDRTLPLTRRDSPEFSAGRAASARLVRSAVEVLPSSSAVAARNTPAQRSRARGCYVRFLRVLHARWNLERQRRGGLGWGPFTLKTVPVDLPGVGNGTLTRIDEARLRRDGSVRIHIYKDIYGFTVGPAEIELETTGFTRPVAAPVETRALHLLAVRALSHAI